MIKNIGNVEELAVGESTNGIRNGYKVEYQKEVRNMPEINEGDDIVVRYNDLIFYFKDIYWFTEHIYEKYIFNFHATDFRKLKKEDELTKEII